jgi:2-oxoglutarate dehydrogenase E2 component (dihydrolipoamide succinyltransferase)
VADIRVPKLNNNDQAYILVEWLAPDDEPVKPGDALATLETSKAAEDMICEESGILWQVVRAGAECQPGDVICRVVPPGTERGPIERATQPEAAADDGAADEEPVITQAAQELIDQLSIGADQLRQLDTKVVRAVDVERLAAGDGGQDHTYKLPAGQRAVARNVRRSHESIPAAYTVVKVDIGAAQEVARQLGIRLRKMIGLPELLIAAVAPLYQEYPLFFAAPVDEDTVLLAKDAHIGLTVDADNGLFVPVVKNASTRTIEEIAEAVGTFRLSASRGRFREQDLSGGNISIALHRHPDVVMAIPLIFPGQTCCLALAGAQQVLVKDDEDNVAARTIANIGLAYDHRFINGAQALQFLQSVKEALESPDRFSEVGNRR